MIQVRKHSAGFTIIELTLSMGFISVLLLSIAMLTLQISTIYNKGMTVRAVNEAGQLLTTDVQREINLASAPGTVPSVVYKGDNRGGRLCVNTTVYAWNYANTLTTGGFNQFEPSGGPATPREMRFVKFSSTGAANYCEDIAGSYPNVPLAAVDLLAGGDALLALYYAGFNFTSSSVESDGSGTQVLYTMSMTIGSGEEILKSNVDGCKTPTNRTDDSYCAINNFTFTARAGNVNE